MNALDLFAALPVLAGAAILVASIVQGARITRGVSRPMEGMWKLALSLMVFFLGGYLLFVVLLVLRRDLPMEMVAAGVFFGGACYVYLIIKLTTSTLDDLRRVGEERHRAEIGLRDSEARHRALLDAMPDHIFRVYSDGTFLDHRASGAFDPLLSQKNVLGRNVAEVLPPEVAERMMNHIGRALASPGVQVFEYRLSGSGGPVDFEARVVGGGASEVLAIVREVTGRKRAERALERAKEELETQNVQLRKLDRVKDALISDVSHELKTPVAKQAMQLEILRHVLERFGIGEKVQDIIDIMEGGLLRQQAVIRNILMMSRLETGGREVRTEDVRVDGVIEEVVAEYMHAVASFGIQLQIDLRKAVARADWEMLWHVFSNLLNNAIKYRRKEDPRVDIAVEEGGGEVLVRIADNGIGFSEGERRRAFERFYQSSTSAEGIGLGLNISQRILERMGGSIRLMSEGRDRGTTVEVRLQRKK